MTITQNIEKKIREGVFALSLLEVINESSQHNVPVNSETHFKLVIVSKSFRDISLIKRHQMVYSLLQDELHSGVHALALHTYTLEEWKSRQRVTAPSPKCLGGNT